MGSTGPGKPRGGRVRAFDIVRGFSVVSMVAFHLCYDLRFISGVDLAWFAPPLQDIWRASISWSFLFVAGCMSAHSRDNLSRAGRYGAVAGLVFLATTVAAVDAPISFGIIYCMAASTLVAWALARAGVAPRGRLAAAVLIVLFLALLGLPQGVVGLGPLTLEVPAALYRTGWLAWLGLPGAGFVSGDYYPLLPYLMLYLAGGALAALWRERGYPAWAREARCAPLELVGRHALLVYVVHQPVLLTLSSLVAGA